MKDQITRPAIAETVEEAARPLTAWLAARIKSFAAPKPPAPKKDAREAAHDLYMMMITPRH